MFVVFYSIILSLGISQITGLSNLYICSLMLNVFVYNFSSLCKMLILWMIGKTKLYLLLYFWLLELSLAHNKYSVNICWMKEYYLPTNKTFWVGIFRLKMICERLIMENIENCWHSPGTLEEADFVVRIYVICTCFLAFASHSNIFSLQIQLVLFWFFCCGLISLPLFLNLLILNQRFLSKTKFIILPWIAKQVCWAVCWIISCQLDISWSHLRGGNVNEENASIRSSCRAFSEWLLGEGPAHCGWCHPCTGGL